MVFGTFATQERLLGAALGTVFTGVLVFQQRKSIYKSIADTQSQLFPQSQVKIEFLSVLVFVFYE